MKCKECEASGLKSTITIGMSSTTCMYSAPFYDEEGKYHSHDPNTTSTSYHCSKGHSWTKESRGRCGSCDYPDGPGVSDGVTASVINSNVSLNTTNGNF